MQKIKNYMEEVVFSMVNDVLKDIKMCQCEKCILDVSALALDDLPSKYIVTEKGNLYTKVNSLKQQFEVDVISAIAKAAMKVKKFPRHEEL